MAETARVRAPGTALMYPVRAVFGIATATLAIVAATHVGVSLAIIAVFVVMTGMWWLGHARDGVAVLTMYLGLLFVLPAPYSIVGLKSVGAPAFLVASGLGVWWLFERIWPDDPVRRGSRPIHLLISLFVLAWFASYAVSQRYVHVGVESRAMDRTLLVVAGWVGVALTVVDGARTRERLYTLARRIVYFGGYVAFVAILQSRRWYDLARFDLPGLTIQGDESSTYDVRSGFDRISSTTAHPIELATVLGVLFPLALHFLVHARTKSERVGMALCTALIGVAMPMAVTRTGVLTFFVALVVLIPSWPRPWRKRFYRIMLPSILFVRTALPGLLGTLKSLFTTASDDPSVKGRSQDLPFVFDLIGHNPVFGMGPGTFSPQKYFFLDNQFLGTSVELGGLGALTLVMLFVGAPVVAGQAARLSGREHDRLFARALCAGVLAGFVSFFTFDALSFPVISALLFLYIGMIGALYRFNEEEAGARVDAERVLAAERAQAQPEEVAFAQVAAR